MLADEITAELRARRDAAVVDALRTNSPVTAAMDSKGIHYGTLTATADGRVDASRVTGVDADLRVRPFFAHGGTISIREFVIGALNNEMGLQASDPEVTTASNGGQSRTPGGMMLNGKTDSIEIPPDPDPTVVGKGDFPRNQVETALVDYLEFYLLNYFKPALYEQNEQTKAGRLAFDRIGCAQCHVADLQIDRDRRVADVETTYDPARGVMNALFATASPLIKTENGMKLPLLQPFLVKNIFTDFKRHDLGPNFHERNYDGSMQTEMMTTPLWGVGTTAPYGHDGRSINLQEVILRHGGEAQASRESFTLADPSDRSALMAFLNSLVLFPPDDTASNLDPGDRNAKGFPQLRHGALKLTVLFNDPTDIE